MARERLATTSRRAILGAAAAAILTACGGSAVPAPVPTPAASPAPIPMEPTQASTRPPAGRYRPPAAVLEDVALIPLAPDEQQSASIWREDGWQTDFSIKSVHLSEITQAAAGRDIIPPIDAPQFARAAEMAAGLPPNEPIAVLQLGDLVRAYPLRVLTWHEIVNDQIDGLPVAVTFCPLCNTAIGFSRQVENRTLRLGVSANLRASNLILWDDETESWWQQSTGQAIVGTLTGYRLGFLPMAIASFQTYLDSYPDGLVLTEQTGYSRRYGSNPYLNYDSGNRAPFLFFGQPDERLPATERVVVVEIAGEQVAFPYLLLSQRGVVSDRIGGRAIVIFFQQGTASALDAGTIAESRDVGSAGVFDPVLAGRQLAFEPVDGQIQDSETGSEWNSLGIAVAGPLAGSALTPIVHGNDFWFSWAALRQQVRVYEG